ncbi:MAG: cache domain-containing protein [Candidatus Taylorbacteria bacterium]|nr:cache domain-containing protein [Candidatus Taylorbacteria bacterium]
MSYFFFLNNLHFFLEVLGAVVFLAVAWLAFDAYMVRRDFVTASRGIGFAFLAGWQIFHAFHLQSELYNYLGYVFYFAGLLFILVNLLKEAPVERPKFEAILVLPSLGAVVSNLNLAAAIGFGLIGLIAFRQYKKESKKALIPFVWGFSFLALGAVFSIIYNPDRIGGSWFIGHLFEGLGFLALGWWIWSYLQLRIREELLLILVSLTLVMAVVVGLTFSTILVNNVESSTKASLSSNIKVLNLAVSGLKEEALAKVELLAQKEDLAEALAANNFVELERLAGEYMREKRLGFLSVLDKDGNVVLRAHALTKKDDNLSDETAVKLAMSGESGVAIESSPAEGLSVRAGVPILSSRNSEQQNRGSSTKSGHPIVVGVLVGGFQLDNAFVDSLKKLTGLDVSVYDNETITATTILNPDRKSRSVGLTETNRNVLDAVFKAKNGITLNNLISSRPYLATYLPITDNDKVVGMLSVAKAQNEILNTVTKTNRLTFVMSAIILLILVMPLWWVTRRLTGEV